MAGGNIPAVQRPWFVAASRATGVPANVLAGIASVESNIGANASTSSAGAQGEMQFEPGTAAQFHLNPYNTPQAILDAGKLLLQYGYRQNPLRAIGAYNGGPGNPQYGYANQVMAEARRLASQIGGGGQGAGALPQMSGSGSPTTRVSSNLSVPVTTFDKQGFQQAQRANVLGNFLSQTARNDPWGDGGAAGFGPLFAAGKATMSTPDPAQFFQTGTRGVKVISAAQTNLQKVAGGTVLMAHPQVQGRGHLVAGGFLPAGAKYVANRHDQGRDGITNPGGPIIANGNGFVVRVGSDPSGFGPSYPIVHFTSGPYAGRTIYFGHTLSVVKGGQQVKAGQVLSHTGTSGVGNATVPGWFEIGYADGGTPGPFGQPAPF